MIMKHWILIISISTWFNLFENVYTQNEPLCPIGSEQTIGFEFPSDRYPQGVSSTYLQIFLGLKIQCRSYLMKWRFFAETNDLSDLWLCFAKVAKNGNSYQLVEFYCPSWPNVTCPTSNMWCEINYRPSQYELIGADFVLGKHYFIFSKLSIPI